jgi:SAM-dependent methyltransferase
MDLDAAVSQEVLRELVSLSNDDSESDGQERVATEEQSSCPAPKSNSLYGTKDYWEERFSTEKDYEWLLSYAQLASQLTPFLQQQQQQPIPSRILVIGCGNAPFSADMYDAGYHNIVNIDYSEVVISVMKERHSVERPNMEWRVMDMTDLSELADETFDVVIDKAAMDAMMAVEGDVWNPSQICVDQAQSICQHVSRILVPGGHFLQISLA